MISLPVGEVANAKLEDKYLDFPLGEVRFGGVKFLLKPKFSIFDTTKQMRQPQPVDGTTLVSLQLPESREWVRSVHILINASGGRKSHPETSTLLEGSKIGSIKLAYTDGTSQDTDLVLGRNIREWAIGNAPDELVSRVTDSTCQLAWRGSNTGGKYAVIDRLEIPVLAANRGKELESIAFVRDIPRHSFLLTTPHLHFFVSAVTLEIEPEKRRS
jgi:hypothetical protein